MEQNNNKEGKKKLPSKNFSLDSQVQILKTIAVIHQTKRIGSNYKDLAKHVNGNPTSVSEALQFWKQVGILENEGRNYIPSATLVEFNKQIQWDDENSAWETLGNSLMDSWFMEALKIKFQIKNSLSYEELLQTLGSASGVPKRDSRTDSSLNVLINLLEKTNLVKKGDDGNYTIGKTGTSMKKEIRVEDDKDMTQVAVGTELYAVDSAELKKFIISNGKKLGKEIQRVD